MLLSRFSVLAKILASVPVSTKTKSKWFSTISSVTENDANYLRPQFSAKGFENYCQYILVPKAELSLGYAKLTLHLERSSESSNRGKGTNCPYLAQLCLNPIAHTISLTFFAKLCGFKLKNSKIYIIVKTDDTTWEMAFSGNDVCLFFGVILVIRASTQVWVISTFSIPTSQWIWID